MVMGMNLNYWRHLLQPYQWLTLSATIVITVFQCLLFTSASRIVSPIETQAVAAPGADPATSLVSEPTGRNSPSKSGEAP
jgi:hypothetical protein